MCQLTNSAFRKTVVQALAPLLNRDGFRRFGAGFRKDVANVAWFVEPQVMTLVTEPGPWLTINLGVFSKELMQLVPDVFFEIDIGYAPIRVRIGSLMPVFQDKWWHPRNEVEVKRDAEEIRSYVSQYALPFLHRFHSTREMLPFLRNPSGNMEAPVWTRWLADVYEGRADPKSFESVSRQGDSLSGDED